ncbi:hypothetical protein ASPZODRAFT_2072749 [Penicilliopsis zonata CBS 506.65]|uniref:Mis18 domain-containing protein n=1 Tax=Penicilliopsis zonata CBS 506.65 TaxID=1073090 RepID=A0A1L9SGF9_9EURO|nr:hypothetical protein ASPZODRAFT_2072749 [Penicilliopsis zonata CBS 506.65]OJJ46203.1 hypothetical protein ASPZODRAFT_2072749 [Penicilliopsis zonata CBS 506.65]
MDLSALTRPAILCQCSRCSSSLAALENEWAKLSNSYSFVTGWLSLDLNRVSISLQKKQVPQSSDLSLLRGRILQEVTCKLCQQKLGVLCLLDSGPNIFWKLGKVSFREIVTMRTVEPIFKAGSPEQFLYPQSTGPSGALVPLRSLDMQDSNISVEQQIQHQGASINHISSSVSNLHDTMSELKHAFTALRLELNGPGSRSSTEMESTNIDFDMIATVLRELKSKSEEIERLKLEIEALKLKNRVMEEQAGKIPSAMRGLLPEMQGHGLLQATRKRGRQDSLLGGRTHQIMDSFDDSDEVLDDLSVADYPSQPIRIPLKEPATGSTMTDSTSMGRSRSGSAALRIEISQSRDVSRRLDRGTPQTQRDHSEQPTAKRPRLDDAADVSYGAAAPEKRRPGRPRKSFSQAPRPVVVQTPKATPLSEQTGNTNASTSKSYSSVANETPNTPLNAKGQGPGRPRSLRGRRKQSVSSLASRAFEDGEDTAPEQQQPEQQQTEQREPEQIQLEQQQPEQTSTETNPPNLTLPDQNPLDTTTSPSTLPSGPSVGVSNIATLQNESLPVPQAIEPPPSQKMENVENETVREKRKAQINARDLLAKLAMQREEAMEMEEAR